MYTPKNPTIYNIIHWFAGTLGRMTGQQSVWCSKQSKWFLQMLSWQVICPIEPVYCIVDCWISTPCLTWICFMQISLAWLFKTFKNRLNRFLQKLSKRNNTWNIRRLVNKHFSKQTSELVYYIVDCRIFSFVQKKISGLVLHLVQIFLQGNK